MRTLIVCSVTLHEVCVYYVVYNSRIKFQYKLLWCKYYTLSTTVIQEHFIDTYYILLLSGQVSYSYIWLSYQGFPLVELSFIKTSSYACLKCILLFMHG